MITRTYLRRAAQVMAGVAVLLHACCAPVFGGNPARQPSRNIVLSFVGDCTFGAVNGDGGPARFPTVLRQSGRADYPFARVKPDLRQDDLSIANAEGTFTRAVTMAHKQWHFKGDARYASLFKAGSVEAVSLANNHAHDYLAAGFRDTCAAFAAARVPVFYENHPFVTTVRGVPVVVIGDCTVVGENTTRLNGVAGRVLHQIKLYKRPGNVVVVMMHWGSELAAAPFQWQRQMARAFVDAGADAVIGCHPHVLQGLETYRGKHIAYSLGNFAFGGNTLARRPETCILRLRFAVTGWQTGPAKVSLIPCWITSTTAQNAAGVLRNNYQPRPVFGREAAHIRALILARSAVLRVMIDSIPRPCSPLPRLCEQGLPLQKGKGIKNSPFNSPPFRRPRLGEASAIIKKAEPAMPGWAMPVADLLEQTAVE